MTTALARLDQVRVDLGRPRPNFFLVGAPKCGTTAMYAYLRQHPQIFMPFHKEPLFFGVDLTTRYGRMSLEEYLALFADATSEPRIGEASAWYLYSATAAAEIKAFAPDAQIVVMLRDPVEVMQAQHSQLLFNMQETLTSFAQALAAEPDRRAGRRLPPGPIRVENLFYREMVRFADQLQRYWDVFGREHVHVIWYEDFRDRAALTYKDLLRFLGVSDVFTPDFGVRNPNKRARFGSVQRWAYQPPAALRRLVPGLRRYSRVHWLRDLVLRLNSVQEHRATLDPGLRVSLERELRPEVERLANMTGRDLSRWISSGNG